MPATIARFFAAARSAVAITERTPSGSVATGFSVNTCLPASIAAARCSGRKNGGAARITRSTGAASTFLKASKPLKHSSGVAVTRPGSFLLRSAKAPCTWSGNRSPIAAITTSGEAFAQSTAAPVPRPPQPIRPTRIFSDVPAANTPEGANAAAIEASDAVLMSSRRVSPGTTNVFSSVIALPRFKRRRDGARPPAGRDVAEGRG